MVDLHSHILPGFDDGAKSPAEAVEMACQAEQDGIGVIVATPHIIEPAPTDRERILAAVDELQERLTQSNIRIRLLPGAEIHINSSLVNLAKQGRLMTLNDTGKYLLLELPLLEIPWFTETTIFGLLTAGITPVIAHPERNQELARRPELLRRLVERGCLTQISSGSLRGRFGREAQKAAELFFRKGLGHLLATDAHGAVHRRARMAEARAILAKSFGRAEAEAATCGGPGRIVAGEPYGGDGGLG